MSGRSSMPARRSSASSARRRTGPCSTAISSAISPPPSSGRRSSPRRSRRVWSSSARAGSRCARTAPSRRFGCAASRPSPSRRNPDVTMDRSMSAVARKISVDVATAPDHGEALRIAEALLFAAREPLAAQELSGRLPEGSDVTAVLAGLAEHYADRGVNLVQVAGKWAFRTAGDLSFLLARDVVEPRKLSSAAMEALAIVPSHQPVTRAEIEEIRGVVTSKGTLDTLLETGWIRLRGRRKAPGRPVTYGTTPRFLEHFGLNAVDDLPGLEELKGTGMLDTRLPTGFTVPTPSDDAALREDEDPLEAGDTLDLLLAPAAEPETPPENGGES